MSSTTEQMRKRLFVCLICALFLPSCLTHLRQSKNRCPRRKKDTISGWVEQINTRCVLLVSSEDKMFYTHPDSLPFGAKEGDYLLKGLIQSKQGKQDLLEIKAMLAKRAKLPRIFRLSGSNSPKLSKLPKRNRYRRGKWKRWQAKREKQRLRRKSVRFRRRKLRK